MQQPKIVKKKQTFQLRQLMTSDLGNVKEEKRTHLMKTQQKIYKPSQNELQQSSKKQHESIPRDKRREKLRKLEHDLDEISLELKMDNFNDLYCRKPASQLYIEPVLHADYSIRFNKTANQTIRSTPKMKRKTPQQQDFSSMKIDDLQEHELGMLNVISDKESPPTQDQTNNRFKVKLSNKDYESVFERDSTFYEKKAFVDIFRKKWKQDKGYCSLFNKRSCFKQAKKNKVFEDYLQVQGSRFSGEKKESFDTYFQIQNSIKQKTINLMIDKKQFINRAATALKMEKQSLQQILQVDELINNTNEIPVCKPFPIPKYQRTLKTNVTKNPIRQQKKRETSQRQDRRRFELNNLEEQVVQYSTLLKYPERRGIFSKFKDENRGIFYV